MTTIHNSSAPAQPTVIVPSSTPEPVPIGMSWLEVQTVDGRVYYFNSTTRESRWDKPEELKTPSEISMNATDWREFRIWDGRSYFFNSRTKCSVWTVPPEVASGTSVSSSVKSKSRGELRQEFHSLLVDAGITESHSFADAMDLVKDDMRFHALSSPQEKQMFFASFVANLGKRRIQAQRDAKRALMISAVTEWKNWKSMNESVTFVQMESHFKEASWFRDLDRVDVMKLFRLFSIEFSQVEILKKQKLQDSLMQEMKIDVLNRLSEISLSSPNVFENIHRMYSEMSPVPLFWETLSESQKLVVIKSCITQRIREVRLAVSNNVTLPRDRRLQRRENDRVKSLIASWMQTDKTKKWNSAMEEMFLAKKVDIALAKEMFAEFLDDMQRGKDPLDGID